MKKLIALIFVVCLGCSNAESAPAGPITVTLLWDAVTVNADGTPCTDLAGYNLYYGWKSNPVAYANKISVGKDVTTVTTPGLKSAQQYYFAVTAIDLEGNESKFSNEVGVLTPDRTSPLEPANLRIG